MIGIFCRVRQSNYAYKVSYAGYFFVEVRQQAFCSGQYILNIEHIIEHNIQIYGHKGVITIIRWFVFVVPQWIQR